MVSDVQGGSLGMFIGVSCLGVAEKALEVAGWVAGRGSKRKASGEWSRGE